MELLAVGKRTPLDGTYGGLLHCIYAKRNWRIAGVAVGTAYCIHEIFVNPNMRRLADAEVRPQLAKYEQAPRGDGRRSTGIAREGWQARWGPHKRRCFSAHESILHDPAFTEKIRHWIVDERQSATAAPHNVMNEYASLGTKTGRPPVEAPNRP